MSGARGLDGEANEANTVLPPPARRRHRNLLFLGCAAAALAGLAAALAAGLGGGTDTASLPPAARPAARPFTAALAALAGSPVVRYRSDVPGLGEVDVRVTAGGELVGTATENDGTVGLLVAGGRLYVKLPSSDLPTGGNEAEAYAMKGKWLTGSDVAGLVGDVASRFATPLGLAAELAGGLSKGELPPSGDSGTLMGGVRVLEATTPAGDLYVTKNPPYRVVGLVPAPSGTGRSPGAIGAVGTVHGVLTAAQYDANPVPGEMDFPAESPGDVSGTFQALENDTAALSQSVDTNLSFSLQGNAAVSCSDAGCEVSATVTAGVQPGSAGGQVTGGTVAADLTATVQIGGIPGGECAGSGSLPLNGTGALACSVPGSGAVFAEVEAQKKAEAEAQSQAEGGAYVSYSIPYEAEAYVFATAQVNVSALVSQEQQESDLPSTCPATAANVMPDVAGLHFTLLSSDSQQCEPLSTPPGSRGRTAPLTTPQATDLARYLGYRPTNSIVDGQRVFTNGKSYIVQDRTSDIGGVWKIAKSVKALSSKATRQATTDALLTEIGG